jgi:hypothetical protein
MKQVPKPEDTKRLFVGNADIALPPTGLGFKVEIERILADAAGQRVEQRLRAVRAIKRPLPDDRGSE